MKSYYILFILSFIISLSFEYELMPHYEESVTDGETVILDITNWHKGEKVDIQVKF